MAKLILVIPCPLQMMTMSMMKEAIYSGTAIQNETTFFDMTNEEKRLHDIIMTRLQYGACNTFFSNFLFQQLIIHLN